VNLNYQIIDTFLIEGPVRDIISFLRIIFPFISSQMPLMKPVKDIPDNMNLNLGLL